MTCWIDGERCIHELLSTCFRDSLKYVCIKCTKFDANDLKKNFEDLGFSMKEETYFFDEEDVFSLDEARGDLSFILGEKIREVSKHFKKVKEIRETFLRKLNPHCSDLRLEYLVGGDLIVYDFEEYLEELTELQRIFDKE